MVKTTKIKVCTKTLHQLLPPVTVLAKGGHIHTPNTAWVGAHTMLSWTIMHLLVCAHVFQTATYLTSWIGQDNKDILSTT